MGTYWIFMEIDCFLMAASRRLLGITYQQPGGKQEKNAGGVMRLRSFPNRGQGVWRWSGCFAR
jgi:hypothetical protein